jgi:hypothetical protein
LIVIYQQKSTYLYVMFKHDNWENE